MTSYTAPLDGTELSGRYADWPRAAPHACPSCGSVSNFPCRHQRGSVALAEGDHVQVQMGAAVFGAVVLVIVTGEFGGVADVEPDNEPGRVVSVSFGPAAGSQITPLGAVA